MQLHGKQSGGRSSNLVFAKLQKLLPAANVFLYILISTYYTERSFWISDALMTQNFRNPDLRLEKNEHNVGFSCGNLVPIMTHLHNNIIFCGPGLFTTQPATNNEANFTHTAKLARLFITKLQLHSETFPLRRACPC